MHAKLSPSSAHRWMPCPGSIALCENIPSTTSAAAEEGTAAHWVLEQCLITGRDPVSYLADVAPNEVIIDQDMARHVSDVLDWLYNEYPEDDVIKSETMVHPDFNDQDINDNCYGTADIVALDQTERSIFIGDLKYGHTPVDPFENEQGLIYAIGAVDEFMHDAQEITIAIFQPRLGTDDNPAGLKGWTIFREELEMWRTRLMVGAEKALSRGAPLVAGDKQCRFCPAGGICKERLRHAQDIAAIEFAPNPTLDGALLTPEELAEAISQAGELRRCADALEAAGRNALMTGQPVPGYKLVWGQSRRYWPDQDAVLSTLRRRGIVTKATDRKLKSPAQMEKAFGKKSRHWAVLSDHVGKTQANLTMVKESDRREAVAADFDVIEKEVDKSNTGV